MLPPNRLIKLTSGILSEHTTLALVQSIVERVIHKRITYRMKLIVSILSVLLSNAICHATILILIGIVGVDCLNYRMFQCLSSCSSSFIGSCSSNVAVL